MNIYEADEQSSLDDCYHHLRTDGVVLIRAALQPELIGRLHNDLYSCLQSVQEAVGSERLERAGEVGVVRAPLVYSESFQALAAHESVLGFADSVVGPHSILHLQNGFVLPSQEVTGEIEEEVFQASWHRDFPRYLNGSVVSINAFVPLTSFTVKTGATQFLLGSHQSELELEVHLREKPVAHAEAEPGDFILFDSTIWHRAGANVSGKDRLATNLQFTLPWIKQQLDISRFFAPEVIEQFPPDLQRVCGYFSRVPDSLDAFYQPPEKRYYRSGQG